MANAVKGEVEFDIGDKRYILRWSTNAMCELEGLTGRGFNSIARELVSWMPPADDKGNPLPETEEQSQARGDRVKLSLMRAIFCAMLRDRLPDVSIKDAGDLVETLGVERVMGLISQTFERGNPETKGARPPQEPKAAA